MDPVSLLHPLNVETRRSHDAESIKQVARQFEGVLIESLVNSLQQAVASLPGDQTGLGVGAYQSLGTQALASGFAASGGFGLAEMITKNLIDGERLRAQTGAAQTKVSGVSADIRGRAQTQIPGQSTKDENRIKVF